VQVQAVEVVSSVYILLWLEVKQINPVSNLNPHFISHTCPWYVAIFKILNFIFLYQCLANLKGLSPKIGTFQMGHETQNGDLPKHGSHHSDQISEIYTDNNCK
jgi:hypothetical protein